MSRCLFVLALFLGLVVPQSLAQLPASWLSASVGQALPHDWDWSLEGQLRTPTEQMRWNEGLIDVGLEKSLDVFPAWSLGGQWRTGWDWPPEGGWTTSWRWATSIRWSQDIGDDKVGLRVRHQFGGPWMRPWDRARWRVQTKWNHDLPDGWKLEPSMETFFGPNQERIESDVLLIPVGFRARLALDKKLSKRRHLTVGYQVQSPLNSAFHSSEHTLLLSWDLELKKVKKRQLDDRGF